MCCKLKRYYRDDLGHESDFWCTPGGGVDAGEAIISALQREMIEETDVMPDVGKLLYVHQFVKNDNEITEFFFHVTNADDYNRIDLSKSSHGQKEISEIKFIDPKTTPNLLPKFLREEEIEDHIKSSASPKFFSFFDESL